MDADDNFGLSILLVHGVFCFILFRFISFTNWMSDYLKLCMHKRGVWCVLKDCVCECVCVHMCVLLNVNKFKLSVILNWPAVFM